MSRVLGSTSERRVMLGRGFELAIGEAGSASRPGDLPDGLDWIPAPVPGTAARALELAGRWSRTAPMALHDRDVWYRCRLEESGERVLEFDGLATLAEVWLDDRLLLRSENMFVRRRVPVRLAAGATLYLAFRALAPDPRAGRGRGGWPVPMIADPALRHVRTTLLGHMPGWCPSIDHVGPWRGVALVERTGPLETLGVRLAPGVEAGRARLEIELDLRWAGGEPPAGEGRLGERRFPLARSGPGRLRAELDLPDLALWWPWTHGEPALHELALDIGGERLEFGRIGFREVTIERGSDRRGFGFRVNGVPVFARGANWMPVDPVGLDGTRATVAPALRLLREAGCNMLRVPGTTVYEDTPFHELCDELGILLWQDLMLANLDYPVDDPSWRAGFFEEVVDLLDRTELHPSLVLLCGGSEIAQQAAMTGRWERAEARWRSFSDELAALVARLRPDLPFLPHTPWSGASPFSVREGPAHAYGVGAYLRPIGEARSAAPRFATECLALAQLPEPASLARIVSSEVGPGHDPRWKALVPRDRFASWDFEDVREHYLEELFAVDARELRRGDPERWLELSRAASVELVRRVLAEWRRPGSSCRGALLWHARDLAAGTGFGVIDAFGRPKPAWHAMTQVLQPLQLLVTDEGLDGLDVHLLNDRPESKAIRLELVCLREGALPIARGAREVRLEPRGALTLQAWTLLGGFFDLTRAYRFGPPQHDAVVASAFDPASGALLGEAVYLPGRLDPGRRDPDLEVALEGGPAGWVLRLRCCRLARFVQIDDPAFRPTAAWFHLPPGRDRLVALEPIDDRTDARPRGRVRSLDCPGFAAYGAGGEGPPS